MRQSETNQMTLYNCLATGTQHTKTAALMETNSKHNTRLSRKENKINKINFTSVLQEKNATAKSTKKVQLTAYNIEIIVIV